MAQAVRTPPGSSDWKDFRAWVYFFIDLFAQNRMWGEAVVDLPSIAAGGKASFTIRVDGAIPGKAQTIEYGLPPTWDTDLIMSSVFVSATDTVTMVVRNPTGASIDMPSATYGVRVRP